MEQNPHAVARTYDAVAKEYAEMVLGEHDRKPLDQEILRRFSEEVGSRRPVWDFGCGSGQTAEYLSRLGIEVSGLDLSEGLIGQAIRTHPHIHFQKGNLLDLEFKNESIAAVVAFYAIVHFSHKQVLTAFREVFRVLQPNGPFLLTYHIGDKTIHMDEFLGKAVDIDFVYFETDFISGCLEETGFERMEVIERDPYPGVEYQSRRAYMFARKPLMGKRS